MKHLAFAVFNCNGRPDRVQVHHEPTWFFNAVWELSVYFCKHIWVISVGEVK